MMKSLKPVITPLDTEHYLLEPFCDRHFSRFYLGWLKDEEVVRFTDSRHAPDTAKNAAEFVARFDGLNRLLWAIVEKNTSRHIGNANLYVDWHSEIAELGIMIGEKKYWGKGAVYECFKRIIDYSFYDLNLFKVFGGVKSCNLPIIFNFKKLKFTKEAVFKDHVVVDGKRFSELYYSILRDEWLERDDLF